MNRVTGGTLPASIWRDYMAQAHEGLPYEPLNRTDSAPDRAFEDETVSASRELRDFLYEMSVQFEESAYRFEDRRSRRRPRR